MILRVSSGILLSLVGTYVVVGEHLAGVSSTATVNAPIVVIRAPIDGGVTLRGHRIGSFVAASEALGSIRDDRVDPGRMLELQRAEAALQSEITRLQALLAATYAARELFGADSLQARRTAAAFCSDAASSHSIGWSPALSMAAIRPRRNSS